MSLSLTHMPKQGVRLLQLDPKREFACIDFTYRGFRNDNQFYINFDLLVSDHIPENISNGNYDIQSIEMIVGDQIKLEDGVDVVLIKRRSNFSYAQISVGYDCTRRWGISRGIYTAGEFIPAVPEKYLEELDLLVKQNNSYKM